MIHLATVLIAASQIVSTIGPQTPPRDRVPAPRVGTGVVKGRVVDGTTGAAVPRARVMLQGVGPTAPVLTDGEGGFSFTALPSGPVTLMVQKSTYLPTRYPAAGRTIRAQSRPVILRDGQVIDNVVVSLFHGASISGRVFDADGDPLENAQVSLLRVPAGGRTGKPTMAQGTQTNDLGEFRIGRLEAGTYLVQVTGRREGEMYFPPNGAGAAPAPPLPQPLPTFYPGALALEQAQPIVVERGQAISSIDVMLADGIPGTITGTVTTADGQPLPPNTFPNVMIRRVMSDKVPGWFDYGGVGAMSRPDGTFRAVVSPGEYIVEARLIPRNGGPPRPEDEQLAMTRVSIVSGGEESLTLTVGPGASATGRVTFEGTTPPPPSPGRIRVPMMSEAGNCRSGEAEVAADWSFRIQGLSGTCSAQPTGFFGRWTLKSIVINGDNIIDSPFTFQPGQKLRNVQVIVTDRRSSMTFQVADDSGQATRDYVVVAYPTEKERWTNNARTYTPPPVTSPDAMRTMAATPGGNPMAVRPQTLSGLRAGDYYVVAVDDLEFDDTRDPAVLDKLRSSATRVTIGEGAMVEVSLRRATFAEVMRQP